MTNESRSHPASPFHAVPLVVSAGVIGVGSLALIGWMFDIVTFKSIVPGLVTMKANTAVAFVLAGVSLWWLRVPPIPPWKRRLAELGAAMAGLVGLLTFGEYILGRDLGIDQLLFTEEEGAAGTSSPGRMAPTTAINFLLIGLALLLLDRGSERLQRLIRFIILVVTSISFLALAGYISDVRYFYGIASYTAMAVHTSVAFILLCVGILMVRPDRGVMAILTSDSAGGIMARRFLPALLVIPTLLGWLRLKGQQAGLYETEFGLTLYVLATIILFTVFISLNAGRLHRTDVERRLSEQERERFFNLSLDMLCVAGFDGYFKRLNPAWERTLGFTNQELLAQPYTEFIHPDDREATFSEARKIAAGAHTLSFENRYRCKDGTYRWLSWAAVPDMDKQCIYATARDITERRLAEERIKTLNQDLEHRSIELDAANKELEAFSYAVAHDLRAPLRAIDGFSQALVEDYARTLDAQAKDHLRRVRTATQRMAQLIDDLLLLSRVARREIYREQVDLSAMSRSILGELQQAHPDRRVDANVADGLAGQGDSHLLRVVLENLIGNAWKFTARRPRATLQIGMVQNNGEPVYYIRDNGAGFDMAYADKLFGAFQRLHGQQEFPGTGIGLATVQRIIRRHGGRVWAEGEVNKGATFHFTLRPRPDHEGDRHER